MSDPPAAPVFYTRRSYRLLTGTFGLFLIGVGLYVLFDRATSSLITVAGGAALVPLGYNTVASAVRARESWLSKLGPLP